jgi:hypothetical protein
VYILVARYSPPKDPAKCVLIEEIFSVCLPPLESRYSEALYLRLTLNQFNKALNQKLFVD